MTYAKVEKLVERHAEEMYLDFFTNFLTMNRFAEYHNLSLRAASAVVALGRKLNHARPSKFHQGLTS